MSIIIPANTLAAGGFDVDNSLRFERGSNDHLTRTMVAATLATKFTYSFWIKRGLLTSGTHTLFESYEDDNNRFLIFLHPGDDLRLLDLTGGSTQMDIRTNRLFRDPSAWMHIVCAVDTTQGTAGNRTKIYVNGVQESSFSTNTTFDQNDTPEQGTTDHAHTIGKYGGGTGDNYSGYMSEAVFIDGLQLAADQFGEFDEDSGIWKPIKVSGLTFGDNGFYLQFEQAGTSQNSSGMGADTSGEDNHFAVNNLTAIDQSTDTCTNNGCTWNILYRNTATFTEGNLVYTAPSSNPVFGSLTTFGVTAGKWYAECKYHAGSNHYGIIGIADEVFATLSDLGSATNTDLGKVGASLGVQAFAQNSTVAYVINTGKIRNNNSNQNYGSGGGDGQIINIALDRDNRKVYFGINGTYENSGDPGAGSNGFDISGQVTGNEYFLGVTNDTGSSETILDFNFGSGFGLTAVSSANTDANGYGNFEYAVPSGFFAWNTKNLAEHG